MAFKHVRYRYKPDHRSFGAFMRSPRVRAVAVQAAGDIADHARTLALAEASKTGAYANSFRVNRRAPNLRVGGNIRATAHVYNNDPAAAPQEFGDRWGNRGKRILRRAGAKVGELPRGGRR